MKWPKRRLRSGRFVASPSVGFQTLERRTLLAATLVQDINTTPDPFNASNETASGGYLYFTGADEPHGNELWKTDGTTSGLVADIVPGTNSSSPSNLLNVNGTLFFTIGSQVWKSDGSAAGTVFVTSKIGSETGLKMLGALGSKCFVNYYGNLWVTDGTDAGTNFLSVSYAGSTFEVVGQTAYFVATDAAHGTELWRSDGTPAGTSMVDDINPGTNGSSPSLLAALGGELYFAATDGSSGTELWATDGTVAGTREVYPSSSGGPAFSAITSISAVNGKLVLAAQTAASGSELWVSDGTTAGTTMLRDIYAGTNSSSPSNLVVAGSTLYFWANDGVHGNSLWKTDGSVSGTTLVTSATLGAPYYSSSGSVTTVGGSVYWLSRSGTADTLWSSDGSAAGTKSTSLSASGGFATGNLFSFGGRVYYDDGVAGLLWSSGGTVATTSVAMSATLATEGSDPRLFTSTNNGTVFLALDPTHNVELWRTDGTAGGTYLLDDINPGPASSDIEGFVTLNGWAYFSAYNPTYGQELWATDGSTVMRLTDIAPGAGNTSPMDITASGGSIYFVYYATSTNAYDLYRVTPSGGSWALTEVLAGASGKTMGSLTDVGGRLYFVYNSYLYWTLGYTPTEVEFFQSFGSMADVGGRLFFSAYTGSTGTQLWETDGTLAGTTMLTNIAASGGYSPSELVPLGGELLFVDYDGANGDELWSSDGTAAGTRIVDDVNPGPASSNITGLTVAGSLAYFWATTASQGTELWRTDGTPAGTHITADLTPGTNSSTASTLTAVGSSVYFSATDGAHGTELWRSDGTDAGTILAADVYPGPASSSPGPVFLMPDGSLLFAADNGMTGADLWSLPTLAADAGGPYLVPEGGAVTLDASASLDVDPSVPLTYLWDLNGNLIYGETGAAATLGDEVGVSPTFSALNVDGPETVSVSLEVIGGGLTSTATGTIQVYNVAPTATLNVPATGLEGSPVTVSLSGPHDVPADLAAGLKYSFDFYGDGGWEVLNSPTPTATFTFPDNGTFTVVGRVSDKDGGSSTYTAEIAVANVPPTATFSNGGSVAEGTAGTVTFTGQHDPSAADTAAGFTYSYDFNDDGTWDIVDSTSPTAVTPIFPDNGEYTIAGRITDKDGGYTEYTTVVNVYNVAPSATLSVSGRVVTLVPPAGGFDVAADLPSLRFSYDFDSDGTFEVVDSSSPTAVVPTSFLASGATTVTATIADKDGGVTTMKGTVTVPVPDARIGASATSILEGSPPIQLSGTNSSITSGSAIALYEWDTNYDGHDFTADAAGESLALDLSGVDGPGARTVALRVTSDDGAVSPITTQQITIVNAPPTGTFGAVGDTVSFTGVMDFPADLPSLTYSYDFGDDGTFEVVSSSPSAVVPLSFLTPGAHVIHGRVSDKDGGYTDYLTTVQSSVPEGGHLAWRVVPTSAAAGGAFSISAEVEDASGRVVSGADVVGSLSVVGSASLTGDTTATAVGGVMTFSNLRLTKAGVYSFALSSTPLGLLGASPDLTISPSTAVGLRVISSTAQAAFGQAPQTIVALVDAYGNLVPQAGVTVSMTLASNPGSALSVATTDSTGTATLGDGVYLAAGSYPLAFSASGLASAPAVALSVGPAAGPVVLPGGPAEVVVAGSKLAPVAFDLYDATGKSIVDRRSKFTLSMASAPVGARFSARSISAKANVVSAKGLSLTVAGTYVLRLSAPGYETATRTFTVVPAAASRLIEVPPSVTSVGSDAPFSLEVREFDRFGNIESSDDSVVRLLLLSKPTSAAALSGDSSVAFSGGTAVFSGLSLSTRGSYKFAFADGKLRLSGVRVVVR